MDGKIRKNGWKNKKKWMEKRIEKIENIIINSIFVRS